MLSEVKILEIGLRRMEQVDQEAVAIGAAMNPLGLVGQSGVIISRIRVLA